MAQLDVLLLGAPHILRDGQEVNLDTRKAVALLTYLAVTRQPHNRDTLAALLWPDYAQVNARAALRRTLSSLNHALGGTHLQISRESLAISPNSELQIDVDNFERYLISCRGHSHSTAEVCADCLAPLTAAAALYRDDFLAGFSLRDSVAFDEWQVLQAAAFRRRLAAALERLVEAQSASGEFEAAIASCNRWLALDRLHEPAYRRLMLLYGWSGQRASAVQQYRECVQVLAHELGVTPLEETSLLYEAIKQGHILPPPSLAAIQADAAQSGSREPTDVSTLAGRQESSKSLGVSATAAEHPDKPAAKRPTVPLVGRTGEWRTMTEAYNGLAGNGQLIVLRGEAGIGKTRLAEDFLDHVRAAGAITLAGRCYEGEQDLAYAPVAMALRDGFAGAAAPAQEIAQLWMSEVARLLPELATNRDDLTTPLLDNPGAPGRFFEGVRHALLALCDGSVPGVIFFDDLHWADSATLELLAYLARRLRSYPVCILLAWRSAHPADEARLEHLLSAGQRAGERTVLNLGRLSRPAVDELLRSLTTVPGVAKQTLAERLYTETEGVPFFLVQYLAALTHGGAAGDEETWPLPGGARHLLHSRLRSVRETEWQLLATAAVIGRSFDFDTLRAASGRTEEEAILGLEELIEAGLVVEARSESLMAREQILTYDFSHDKLRVLVYEETSLARRRLLHRRVAEAILARPRPTHGPGVMAGQLAHHYRLAGQEALAAEYHKLAGQHARSLYASREALAHLQTALALGHNDVVELHIAIGDLHILLGEYRAAINSYETGAALAGTDRLAQIEHRLGVVYQRRGQWELAEAHLAAALAAYEQQGMVGERARILTDWSLTALQRGAMEQADELARRAFDLVVGGDDLALALANNVLGVIAGKRGDLAAARSHLEQSLALGKVLGDIEVQAAALNNLSLAHGAAGEIERALELAQAALELCVARGDRHREAAIHNNMADLLHLAGRSAEAIAQVKQAVAILGEIGAEAGDLQPAIWKLSAW